MGESQQPDRRLRHAPRKGLYILPSLFTAGNIAAGYYAIMQCLQGSALQPQHFNYAALAIGFAIPFDALDGRIARMTHTASEFGRELDSLADVITFGLAPSILAFTWGFHVLPAGMDPDLRHKIVQFGAFVCFLFLICGASRLARFNIQSNPRPKNPGVPGRKYFVGMPIPAAAGVIVAVVHYFLGHPIPFWWVSVIWMAIVVLLGFLMISRWRFWSGKEINLANRHPFQLVVLIGLIIYSMVFFSRPVLLAFAFIYMFSGIVARAAYSWQRRRRKTSKISKDSEDGYSNPSNPSDEEQVEDHITIDR